MLISKRKLRLALLCVSLVAIVFLIIDAVIELHLNNEFKYYKTFFQRHQGGLQGVYDPLNVKQIPAETIMELRDSALDRTREDPTYISWNKFAYVNYVADSEYLCNTLIQFEKLKQSGTEAKLVLLISDRLLDDKHSEIDITRRRLDVLKNLGQDQVVIKPIQNIVKPKDSTPWHNSFTKLLVFNQTEFERVVYLDNDAILHDNLDELFFLPNNITFAAPLAYWFLSPGDIEKGYKDIQKEKGSSNSLKRYVTDLELRVKKGVSLYNFLPNLPTSLYLDAKNVAKDMMQSSGSASPLFKLRRGKKAIKAKFASNLMVIKPNEKTFRTISEKLIPRALKKKDQYDMDLINDELYNLRKIVYQQFKLFRKVNTEFKPQILVLPYAKYGMLTGSIRKYSHHALLADDIIGYERKVTGKLKSLREIVEDSKYIHFSDYPIAKPWHYKSPKDLECKLDEQDKDKFSEKDVCQVWTSVYEEYLDARKICQ